MKAFINIELQEGETLLQAIDALIPGIGSKSTAPCTCSQSEKPATTEDELTEPAEDEDAVEEKPATEPVKETKPKKSATKAKKASAPADGPDFEEVCAAAMKAIDAGHRADVEKILKDNGGNLPDIDKSNYPDVLAKLEELI